MNEDISLRIYRVMISPVIEYCSFYVGGGHVAELQKLQRMQNQALRVCCKKRVRDVSIEQLHRISKVETLDRRRKLQLLAIMWKKAHGGQAIEQANIRTRGDLKIRFAKRRAKQSFYQKSPYYRGVTLWDNLDKDVQKLPTKEKFKAAIRKLDLG